MTRKRGVTALTWAKPKIKFDFKGTVSLVENPDWFCVKKVLCQECGLKPTALVYVNLMSPVALPHYPVFNFGHEHVLCKNLFCQILFRKKDLCEACSL